MTIASVGACGARFDITSSASWIFNTTATAAAGSYLFVCLVLDNLGVADGNTSQVTGIIDDNGGTWLKMAEYTNSPTAAAGDGVTTSLWLSKLTADVVLNSTDITASFSGAVVNKVCWMHNFSATNALTLSTVPITTEVNAANGFGSAAISGLSSKERLYIRGMGKEANSVTALTPSTSFTATDGDRSQNAAGAILARGEFRINTSTGETSNPTLAVSGDTASVFIAMEEAVSDASFSNVQLLLFNNNTANGGTTFADQSNANRTVTRVSTPTYTNVQAAPWMTTSAGFTTAGFAVTVADSASLELGSGDWTIEMFIRGTGTRPNGNYLINKGTAGNIFVGGGVTPTVFLTLSSDGVTNNISDGDVAISSLTLDKWYYIAFKRSGTSFTSASGISGATTAGTSITSAAAVFDNATNWTIGDGDASDDPAGWINCFRITIGTARDISVVPSLPFPLAAANSIVWRRSFSGRSSRGAF